MSKFDKDYAESLENAVLRCCQDDEPKVLIRKSDADHTFGVYTSFDDEDYHLECTDETIEVYAAICNSAFTDKYRESMWNMLVEEAETHGFRKTLPNLSKVSDDDLTAEMKRRGLII